MARRSKIPECQCIACRRFNTNGPKLYADLVRLEERSPLLSPSDSKRFLRLSREQFILGSGCDLCGLDATRITFVPQIIKEFFHIEFLCDWCKSRIDWLQWFYQWPICWGSTSDDEIKWFLTTLVYEQFKYHFERGQGFVMWLDCCVKGAHAKRAKKKPTPIKPPWEVEWPQEPEPPDIEITIKRRDL